MNVGETNSPCVWISPDIPCTQLHAEAQLRDAEERLASPSSDVQLESWVEAQLGRLFDTPTKHPDDAQARPLCVGGGGWGWVGR